MEYSTIILHSFITCVSRSASFSYYIYRKCFFLPDNWRENKLRTVWGSSNVLELLYYPIGWCFWFLSVVYYRWCGRRIFDLTPFDSFCRMSITIFKLSFRSLLFKFKFSLPVPQIGLKLKQGEKHKQTFYFRLWFNCRTNFKYFIYSKLGRGRGYFQVICVLGPISCNRAFIRSNWAVWCEKKHTENEQYKWGKAREKETKGAKFD